jgi:genome maintenance exonuclease 1
MKLNQRFEYPELNRVTYEDGNRFYVCPETGANLPSVTTILSATADKAFLVEWVARVGEVEAARQRKAGTDLGSLVHTHVECHILGVERPGGNNLIRILSRDMADKLIADCLPGVEEVWGMEVALYYPGLFAGTCDLVGVYKGKPCIMDHKTAKKMRKREDIGDYFDQLCAYMIAHNEVHGTDIQHGAIFMVDRDKKTSVFEINATDVEKHRNSFLEKVSAYLEKSAKVAEAA